MWTSRRRARRAVRAGPAGAQPGARNRRRREPRTDPRVVGRVRLEVALAGHAVNEGPRVERAFGVDEAERGGADRPERAERDALAVEHEIQGGFHPSEQGYRLWAEQLAAAFAASRLDY